MLKGYQVLIDQARSVQTNYAFRATFFEQRSRLAELGVDTLTNSFWWEAGPFDKTLRTAFTRNVSRHSQFFQALQRVQVMKQLALGAIASKRYQLRHGSYPPSLDALSPEFLPQVPRDPVDGRPLRYQNAGKTYLLYSVGNDNVDNGADPVPASSDSLDMWKGRDWVWPAVGTEQDARAYQQKLTIKAD